jgi:hypothetical protein
MSKGGVLQSRGRTSPPYPAMGCNTRLPPTVSLSLRLTEDLKTKATERAASKGLNVSEYVRDLVEADLSATTPRRRRRKYDDVREELAKIHAAIIACGNQLKRADGGNTDPGRYPDDHRVDQEQILLLKDLVTSVLLLARSIRIR